MTISGEFKSATNSATDIGNWTKAEFESGEEKPKPLAVIPEGIPAELKELPQWVCWNYERRESKWTKVPINPATGQPAKSNDPSSWTTFVDAFDAYVVQNYSGIGLMFQEGGGVVGIDLDKCRKPGDGTIAEEEAKIIKEANTYTEVSPSGTGLKLVALGKLSESKGHRQGNLEIYDRGRFFALTGHWVESSPPRVTACQELIDRLQDRIGSKNLAPAALTGAWSTGLSDPDVISYASKGERFRKLYYDGNISDYDNDHSRADMALVRDIARWTGPCPEQIERIFGNSPLAQREKWQDRADYPERTITKVLAGMGPDDFYSGGFSGNSQEEVTPCPAPLPVEMEGKVKQSNGLDSIPAAIERGLARKEFPAPILASQLQTTGDEADWIWDGILAHGSLTLLSAIPKSGKTTLLSLLLKALGTGGTFCGQEVRPAKVLVISEESQALWANRRDRLGLADHVQFYTRECAPYFGKPTHAEWGRFIKYLAGVVESEGIDVVVFDTVFHFWPATDENASAEVMKSLTLLQRLTAAGAAVLLIAHVRKSDGGQGTATRGSGALPGVVDVIMELRRHDPSRDKDRRRDIVTYGRYSCTPPELVIELAEDGLSYLALGDKEAATKAGRSAIIEGLLPSESPGLTPDEVHDKWPGIKPGKRTVEEDLKELLASGRCCRSGEGKRGSPYRYYKSLQVATGV